ncbi:homocysteine-responsive endoplasmic reticulum-resident ubiquitin-like domain member 2 protein [Eurosta solidaginis]|uniref:homocysteine-responsive endoplasmic reticulum-resident ubiquitin-like domain member 2 protein n=1 Tax=Eurosta solidaginis TaxID=178769 RepID=UPI00353070E6
MNETATATSTSPTSSAAAVADSASTVATTKPTASSVTASAAAAGNATVAATSTSTMSTNAKATSVKLLIKASNQQYDDQILDIDLLWTVKRLKAHLAQVYPNKPPVDEQKLIYSGQLLNDNLLLKDVIRSYKDVYTQNHIIHLVYTPKTSLNTNFKQKSRSNTTNVTTNMSPSGNSNDGLRQRHTTGSNSMTAQPNQQQQQYHQQYQQQSNYSYTPFSQQQSQNSQCPGNDPNNPQYAMPFGFPGQFNMQAMASQQAAMYNWMQQVYSQYMEQCMRMSNTSANGIPNINTTNAAANTTIANLPPTAGVNPFGYNPFLQQLPFIASTATASGVATNNPVIPSATMLSQPVARSATDTNTVQAAAGEQAQAQQERQPAAAPRFPNILQEEQENRDWLDSFFSITRLAIFLTILYLNSSPMRCLAVVIIAGGIYLYHIGVLRIRNERNNNNINRNNNAADADQIRRGVRQIQQAVHADEQRNPQNGEDGMAENAAAAAAAVNGQQPTVNAGEGTATVAATESNDNTNNAASVISVLRTFVVTFFTSLLPETPTL